jgi:hypothetical protein
MYHFDCSMSVGLKTKRGGAREGSGRSKVEFARLSSCTSLKEKSLRHRDEGDSVCEKRSRTKGTFRGTTLLAQL